ALAVMQVVLDAGALGVMQLILEIVFIAALAFLMLRRSPDNVKTLTLFGILTVSFAVIVRQKQLWYGILVSPMVGLLVTAFIVQLSREPWFDRLRGRGRMVARVALPLALLALLFL